MKELLVYRHAKTQKAGENMADFVRELLPLGTRQAEEMAKRLKKREALPDAVISSDAVRAMQTAEITAEAIGTGLAVLDAPELYGSDAIDYLSLAAKQGDDAERLMVVGHNPACEELVELLTGSHKRLRPGSIAWIRLSVEQWGELTPESRGELVEVMEAKAS